MHARAAELIRTLGLQPHPDGGHYREIHRSILAAEIDGARVSAVSPSPTPT